MISATGTSRLQYGSRLQNPAPAPARCRRDAGMAVAASRLSTAHCAAGRSRNCRSRPAGGRFLLSGYLGYMVQ